MKRLIFATAVLAFAHLSLAADYTWVGGASGSWTTLSNWETGGAAATDWPKAGDTASFAADVKIVTDDFDIGGETDTTDALTLQIASGKTLEIDVSISGNGGVTRTGDGALKLNKANPFAGVFKSMPTTASGKGVTYVNHDKALGTNFADFDVEKKGYAQLSIDAQGGTFEFDIPIHFTRKDSAGVDKYSVYFKNGKIIFNEEAIAPGRFGSSISNVSEIRFKKRYTTGNWNDMPSIPSMCHIYYEGGLSLGGCWYLSGGSGTMHISTANNKFYFYTYGMADTKIVCESENVFSNNTALASLGWVNGGSSAGWIDLNGFDQRYLVRTDSSVQVQRNFGFTSPADKPASVILSGKYTKNIAYNGKFLGSAGLTWDSSATTKEFILSNVVSATKGSFKALSGVLRLSDGSGLSALASLEIGTNGQFIVDADAAEFPVYDEIASVRATTLTVGKDGEKSGVLSIPSGKFVFCQQCTYGETALTNGVYAAGDEGAEFLTGEGKLIVNSQPIVTWIGPANGYWSDGANWDSGVKPAAGDRVLIEGGKSAVLDEATAAIDQLLVRNATLTVGEGFDTIKIEARQVTIGAAGVITTAGAFKTGPEAPASRVWIACTDLEILEGGKIDVDGKGWAGSSSTETGLHDIKAAGFGPGAALVSSFGSSHGGLGAVTELSESFNMLTLDRGRFGLTYDDPYAPTLPGSGAASAGATYAGGGAVRIEATGTVTVDGAIQASSPSCAEDTCRGSGGSVWITCATFAGKGSVLANGGSAKYGFYPSYESYYAEGGRYAGAARAGGGGMIRVACNAIGSLTGMRISAAPGYYLGLSGVGKLTAVNADKYRVEADLGTLTFNNNLILDALLGKGLSGRLVGVTNYTYASALDWTWGHVRFAGEGANVVFNGNLTISGEDSRLEIGGIESRIADRKVLIPSRYAGKVLNACTVNGDLTLNGGAFDIRAAETNATMAWGGEVTVTGDLTVGANGYLYPWCDPVNLGAPHFVVGGDFTVAETGTVMADRHGGSAGGASGSWSAKEKTNQRGWLGDNNRSYGLGASTSRGASHGGVGGAAWKWHSGDLAGVKDGSGSSFIVPDEWTAAFPGAGGGATGYDRGGLGGGLVYVEAQGTVTVNGKITAEGGNGGNASGSKKYSLYCMLGAGSGGGVYLSGASFAGSGFISARGGNGLSSEFAGEGSYVGTNVYYTSGCGGGGRIVIRTGADVDRKSKLLKDQSVDYQSDPIVQELVSFTGTLTAAGGTNAWYYYGKSTPAPQKAESYGGNGTVRFLRTVALPATMMIIR